VESESRKISIEPPLPLGNPGSQWPQSVAVKDTETLTDEAFEALMPHHLLAIRDLNGLNL
jgi:hypothetical protein